jgi:tetratricopeptide (TPR) repeat protein
MATKQVMVTAPVLVLLYDRAFVSGSFRFALTKRRWYYASLAVTWLLLGFLMYRSSLAAIGVGFQAGVSWPAYTLTEVRVVTDYLKLAFWPHPLVFDYGEEIRVTDPLAVAPYALLMTAILAGVVIVWRRSPMAGFLGAWFFLILAPTSTMVPIAAQPMAESRMYLPLAAVVVLVALLGYVLLSRKMLASCEEFLATKRHKKSKVSAVTCVAPIGARKSLAGVNTRFLRIFAANQIGRSQNLDSIGNWYYIVLGLMAVGLGALTVRRNYDYRSELSIWEDTVARCPHSSRGQCNLGMALARIPDRWPDAIAHSEEALRLNPTYAEAHNNLGLVLAQIPGRLPDAIAHCEEALRIKPAYAAAHNNLANALAQLPGRLPDAIAHYEEALRDKPDFVEAHSNLAMALTKMPGRLADAVAHGQEALRLNPDYAEAHCNLGVALAKIPGRSADAIAHYEAALRINPAYAEAHNNLANVLAKMPGRMADALAHYEEALRLQPGFVLAHNNLAVELAKIPGRMSDAIAHYETAVRLKPDFVDARNNLAVVYAETGRWEAAIEQMEIAARLNPASTAIRDNLEKLKAMRKQ